MLDIKRSKISKPADAKAPNKSSTSNASKHHKSSQSLNKALENELSEQLTQAAPQKTASALSKPTRRANKATIKPTSSTPRLSSTSISITDLVRPLASSNSSIRRNAVNTILEHLYSPATPPLTKTQALQIHRGLYVALYMHDSKSAISVQNLARTVAATLRMVYERDFRPDSRNSAYGNDADADTDAGTAVDVDVDVDVEAENEDTHEEGAETFPQSALWAAAFWESIGREWVGVDQWRMNKVLMLVRFWVVESITIVKALAGLEVLPTSSTNPDADADDNDDADDGNNNDSEEKEKVKEKMHSTSAPRRTTSPPTALPRRRRLLTSAWQAFLAEAASLPLDPTLSLPAGLRMHVLDVWGDELEALSSTSSSSTCELQPPPNLSSSAKNPNLSKRKEAGTEAEVLKALSLPVKELSIFHNHDGSGGGDGGGEVLPNMPKNVRARAKEVLARVVPAPALVQ